VELGSRTVNNVGSDNPRLYEAQFVLKNTAVRYQHCAPLFESSQLQRPHVCLCGERHGRGRASDHHFGSVTPSAALEGGEVVFAAVISGDTEPITYQWQKSVDGAYVDLVDSATISGATTATMTISGLPPRTWAITGGCQQCHRPRPQRVVPSSGCSPICRTSPARRFHPHPYGTTPGAEGVEHAIDNRIQKYLNFGVTGNNPPFVGPVGFILQPAIGNTIVSALRFYTANDAEARDRGLRLGRLLGRGGLFPDCLGRLGLAGRTQHRHRGRNRSVCALLSGGAFRQYHRLKLLPLSFNNVKNNAAAVAMQIGEIEFLGVVNPNPPPRFTLSPVNVSANEGTTATFTSLATGAAPLAYRWYEVTGGDPGVLLAEQTGPNLSFPTSRWLKMAAAIASWPTIPTVRSRIPLRPSRRPVDG
jgi:hypothetical protein